MLMPYDQSPNLIQPIQDTFGLKIGDNLPQDVISSWAKENKNYHPKSEDKWSQGSATVFISDRTIQGFEMLDGQLGFLVSGTQDIYLKAEGFKEFLEAQTTTTTSPSNGISQNIETIPSEMSVDLKMDSNTGNRNSPTQSAGELKTMIKGSPYETEVLNAYYMGNDGDWYKLNVEKSGVWKWKKADSQPTQNATTTLNKDYGSMSQFDLKQRISDLEIAMDVFDEEDDEYKEFATELDLIKLYIEI
jgi:hypothetical protein